MLAVITLLSFLAFAFTTAVTAAFIYGVSYLGGRLFGSDVPESDAGVTPNAQSRSWNPLTTQAEGIARPRSWGRNLHHGNIVGSWTDVVDDREILYIIIEHTVGPTQGLVYDGGVPQVWLNGQPIGNFGSVEIQERLGTLNQTVMTDFEKMKLEYPQGMSGTQLLLDEPIIVTTPNDYFDDLEYTIMWPNGLRKYHKSGGMDYSASVVKVRIREHPAGGWTEIFNEAVTVRQNSPLFRLYKVNTLDPGYIVRGKQYDLEFTNLTGASERHINDVYLKSFREVIDTAFTRPGKALIGIKAIATEQLSGRLDVKVIREDLLINVYNGTSWTIEYSRNRAWVVWDALTQPVISGDGNGGGAFAIEHYEGMSPEQLDLDFFYEWAEFCSAQVPDGFGDTEDRIACDTILDFQTNVWTFVNELANIGRAHLYWQGHVLTGWIDKEDTETSGLVTMDNIMARSWKSQWGVGAELAGKVEVFFNDSRQGYERTSAPLHNESAGKYTRIISIEGIGIITRGTAIHLANHLLKRNELISNINSFRQYKDGFRYRLGKIIRLQHKVPDWGAGYRARSSSANNKVKLDRDCDASAGDLLFIQSYDETLEKVRTDSYTVASVSGKVVTIVETWDVTPLKNYMVAVGIDGAIKARRIIGIESRVDNFFDITVETYDTDLFDADDIVPDLPDQNYVWAKPANPLQRPVTRNEVIEMINSLMVPQIDTDIPWTSNLTWSGNASDTVSWGKTDADEAIIFRYKGVSYEITPDSTTGTYIYWDSAFSTVFRTTDDADVATAAGNWVVCTNIDGVAHAAVPIQLLHAGLLLAGTIRAKHYAELRNTLIYNSEDSLDNSKPFTIPFKLVSEMTAIVSIKLSFKLMPYRAYSTAASSGGASTSGGGGGQTSSGGGGQTSSGASGYPGNVESDDTNLGNHNHDLGSHTHQMPSHDHDLGGSTESEDGTGNHSHSLSWSSDVSNEDPGDTYSRDLYNTDNENLGNHSHTVGLVNHTHDVDDHTHTVSDHTHSTPNHTHGVTYGIHEESNSPTVHFHIDNGAGWGGASANYTTDQTDIDIEGSISGSGWKAIRFDTDLRCRLAVIVQCKLDLTA